MKTAPVPAPPDADPNVSERTFQVLHEVAVASSGVLDPSAVAQIASDGARELLGVDSAGLGICDPQTGQLRPLGENDPELAERPVDQALDTGVSSTAFRLREPVLIHDYRRWESARPEAVARGIRSVASVPLIARDRAVGALTVRSFKPRFWTTEDVRLLGLLAAEVAPALEAARLHVESERRRAEAEALAELVRVGATERDPDRVIALICEQAGRLIGADYAAVAMITPDGGRIWRGMWGNRSQHWRRRPSGRGTGPLGRTVRERRTIVMENVSDDPAIAPHTHVAEGGKTLLSTPLIFREELLGALTLGWRTPVKPSADQVSLAEALAGYAATVLDNARAYAEQQTARQHAESVADTLSQRERALQALHDVAVAAGGVLDPEALGRLVVESTRALLDFDSAGLYWWNNARGALRPLAESDPNRRTPETVLQPGIGIAGEVYRDGQTLVVEDYLSWPGRLRKISTRIKSVAALPLRLEERTLGVLVVRSHTRRALQPDEINLLELLAAQVAPALEAARLHAESQRRRTEAEALAELARQGAVAHEIKPVVDMVCRRACELIDADFAALLAHGDDGAGWLGVAGNRSDIWHKRRRISGRGPAGKSMAEERTVVFRRGALEADGSLDGLAMMDAEEAETALAVALIRRTGPFGSLVIGWREALNVNAEQRRLAEALGGYAAAVLDNALAHAETERRRTEAEELAELVRQGAVEHDAERVINLICEHATNLTGADYAGIRLIDDEGLTWRGMAGNRTDAWRTPRPSRGAGSTSQAMAAGKTIVSHIKDLQAGSVKLDSDSVRAKEGGVLEMATPFVYRGTARGALIVGWRSEIEPSPDQIRVAEALAGFATVILENARAKLALAQQALYDELTELQNRRLFEERLEQAILVARREAHPIALLLMDLDRFKEVND